MSTCTGRGSQAAPCPPAHNVNGVGPRAYPTGGSSDTQTIVRHERVWRLRCRRSCRWLRCRVGDGGGPSGTALQGEVPNHRKLPRLRVVVVSVAEKAHEMRQV